MSTFKYLGALISFINKTDTFQVDVPQEKLLVQEDAQKKGIQDRAWGICACRLYQEPVSGVSLSGDPGELFLCREYFMILKDERNIPSQKAMNLISRQGYIMNWFLFLCRATSVLIILMFNVQF